MAADDTINPEIPHNDAIAMGMAHERALSSRGFVSPEYVKMAIRLPPQHADFWRLTELLISLASDSADDWKLRTADGSFVAYVPVRLISAVEARFIADGNAELLLVSKLSPPIPVNPIRRRRRSRS